MLYDETVSAFAAYGQQSKQKAKINQKRRQPTSVKIKNRKFPANKKANRIEKVNVAVQKVQSPGNTGRIGKNARRKQRKLEERNAALNIINGDVPHRQFEPKNTKRHASIEEVSVDVPAKKEKLQTIPSHKLQVAPPSKKERSQTVPNGTPQSIPSANVERSQTVSNDKPKLIHTSKTERFQTDPIHKPQLIQTLKKGKSQAVSNDKPEPPILRTKEKSQTYHKGANLVDSIKKTSKFKDKIPTQLKHTESEKLVQSTASSSTATDPPTNDSVEDGKEVFRWLIAPIETDTFFEKFWEKKPCLIQRNDASYFSKLISCSVIDQMLLGNHVEFTKNIDITSYVDGVRETLNPEGRAMPSVVWGHYEDGCSIRLLNPQTFIQPIYIMNATLQEFFHCMVGTNVYLTPPYSQGFAPHYDDIEAFVIQIEGQKRWKLYSPRNKKETLARVSSKNFVQDEIGEPILDKILKPGDVLYFPRGTIHQACTQPGCHSLHITVSMYQKHSFADLFEILMPRMLSRAIEAELDLRRGVPLNIWQNLGKIFTDSEEHSDEREEIMEKCEKLMQKVLRHADLDEAVDLLAKRYHHDALPPALTPAEQIRTVFGANTTIDKNGKVQYGYDITLDTHVRLIRANVLRVVEEENATRLYYYVDNSKEYHEYEPNFIEIEAESVGIVRQLVDEYPDYICTSELEADSDDIKLSTVQGLFERGLLMVDEPSST